MKKHMSPRMRFIAAALVVALLLCNPGLPYAMQRVHATDEVAVAEAAAVAEEPVVQEEVPAEPVVEEPPAAEEVPAEPAVEEPPAAAEEAGPETAEVSEQPVDGGEDEPTGSALPEADAPSMQSDGAEPAVSEEPEDSGEDTADAGERARDATGYWIQFSSSGPGGSLVATPSSELNVVATLSESSGTATVTFSDNTTLLNGLTVDGSLSPYGYAMDGPGVYHFAVPTEAMTLNFAISRIGDRVTGNYIGLFLANPTITSFGDNSGDFSADFRDGAVELSSSTHRITGALRYVAGTFVSADPSALINGVTFTPDAGTQLVLIQYDDMPAPVDDMTASFEIRFGGLANAVSGAQAPIGNLNLNAGTLTFTCGNPNLYLSNVSCTGSSGDLTCKFSQSTTGEYSVQVPAGAETVSAKFADKGGLDVYYVDTDATGNLISPSSGAPLTAGGNTITLDASAGGAIRSIYAAGDSCSFFCAASAPSGGTTYQLQGSMPPANQTVAVMVERGTFAYVDFNTNPNGIPDASLDTTHLGGASYQLAGTEQWCVELDGAGWIVPMRAKELNACASTRKGYKNEWYLDGNLIAISSDALYANAVVKAVWTPNTYGIVYHDSISGGELSTIAGAVFPADSSFQTFTWDFTVGPSAYAIPADGVAIPHFSFGAWYVTDANLTDSSEVAFKIGATNYYLFSGITQKVVTYLDNHALSTLDLYAGWNLLARGQTAENQPEGEYEFSLRDVDGNLIPFDNTDTSTIPFRADTTIQVNENILSGTAGAILIDDNAKGKEFTFADITVSDAVYVMKLKVGTFTSGEIQLQYDTEPPSGTANIVPDSGWTSGAVKVQVEDGSDNVTANAELTVVYQIVDGGAEAPKYSPNAHTASLQADGTCTISLQDEGRHRVYVWLVDKAGNEKQLLADIFQIDKTPPTTPLAVPSIPGGIWTNKPVTVRLTASDDAAGIQEYSYKTSPNSVGAQKYQDFSGGGGGCTYTFDADQDAIYSFAAEDQVGNKSDDSRPVAVRIDTRAPEGSITLTAAGDTSWNSITGRSTILFYRGGQVFRISASDPTRNGVASGVAQVYYWICDGNGVANPQSDAYLSNWIACSNGQSVAVAQDRQFVIYEKIVDHAGNVTYVSSDTLLIDSSSPLVADSGGPQITAPVVTQPTQDGVYGRDVEMAFTVVDPATNGVYSGIRSVTYAIYRDGAQVQGPVSLYTWDGNTSARLQTLGRDQLRFTVPVTLDSNNVTVQITAEDIAGNSTTVTSNAIKLDNTAPVVSVAFTGEPLNGRYFSQGRTATVTVRELNFSPNNINFQISGAVVMGAWTTGVDGITHTMVIEFPVSGEYTFSMTASDMAGHTLTNEQIQYTGASTGAFTVDMVQPTAAVSVQRTDGSEVRKNDYSNTAVTLTYAISELNFDPNDVQNGLRVTRDGVEISMPLTWTQTGEGTYQATAKLAKDGVYEFSLEFSDLAGNALAEPVESTFFLDTTAPVIRVSGIRNESANNDEIIAPVVTVSDRYVDSSEVQISLFGGRYQEIDDFIESQTETTGSIRYQFGNLQVDDLYTLAITVTDPAGNRVTTFDALEASGRHAEMEELQFSVNRHGSVFGISRSTSSLLNQYYTNAPQDVVITETNVDALGSVEVRLAKDLTDSAVLGATAYSVVTNHVDGGWTQNVYTVPASTFTVDGTYAVSVVSVDAADNRSSSAKEEEVKFVVDQTAPQLTVFDLQANQVYNASSKDVPIMVNDLTLRTVVAKVNGDEVYQWSSEDEPHIGSLQDTLLLGSNHNELQTLQIICTDAAGNVNPVDTQSVSDFRITTNLWILFRSNPVLFYSTWVLLAAAILAAVLVLITKKRKKAAQAS